jgi:beta-galactosidase
MMGGVCSALIVSGIFLFLSVPAIAGERLNFNPDWKFLKADPAGAAEVKFDDEAWATVSAPHTFNDADTFDDWSLSGHRGEQNQWGGRAWYRKTFALPKAYAGKKVFLEFEAVRQLAEIYLNGKLLGISKTGFTPFGFDLTPHLRFDAPNVLAVMCDNRFMKDPWAADGASHNGGAPGTTGKLSELAAHFNATIPDTVAELRADQIPWNNPHWHPAHGGIYRNVYLHVTDPLHITLPLYSFLQTTGPYVYATEISSAAARVHLEVPVQNGRGSNEPVELRAEIFDHEGRSILVLKQAMEVAAGAAKTFKLSGLMLNPRRWEPAAPHLYRAVCAVLVKGRKVDVSEVTFGIRAARWDLQTGFYINDRHLKLHGWGQKPTDEWPGLGAAQPDWVHFYTLQLMKQAGGNLVRWGHCPGGPASITAADRLGLVTIQPGVDGESDTRGGAWLLRVSAFRDTIVYCRNNPSILAWEGGNQKVSRDHAQELRTVLDQYDPHGGRAYTHRRADKITAEFMELGIGTEGGREITTLPVVEGEYNREESPRRVWDNFSPPKFGYPEGVGQTYHLNSEQFAVNQVAQFVRKLGALDHSGGANWIFSDSTSGGRVACEVARTSGEVDGVRLPKEAYFVCRTMFRADPQVHIIGHWTYPAGTKKDVFVAANGEAVELFVNGKSRGRGQRSDRYLFTFPGVSWEAGVIKAVSYVNDKPVATQSKRTAGEPVKLRLTPLSAPGGLVADGADVAFVDVEAVDAKGERCPTFQQPVSFEMSGAGEWLGGYESGRTNSIRDRILNLEGGINRVAIRAGRTAGEIVLTARAEGLKPGRVTLRAKAFEAGQGLSPVLPALPWVALPRRGFDVAAADTMPPEPELNSRPGAERPGQYTQSFSYSGRANKVRVVADAQEGKRIYVDREYAFVSLPPGLRGADYVQAANADKAYSAVDLMELQVGREVVISVAHDDRLPRPGWLVRQFKATNLSLTVEGRPMKVFQRKVTGEAGLTFGPNTDNPDATASNMYVVFVQGKPGMLAERQETPGP